MDALITLWDRIAVAVLTWHPTSWDDVDRFDIFDED